MRLTQKIREKFGSRFGLGILGGLAGGAAEIVWISISHLFGGPRPVEVAHAVAAALNNSISETAVAVPLGMAIHMGLAGLLGGAIYLTWVQLLPLGASRQSIVPLALSTLAAVWAVNFYLVLPLLDPRFLVVVPAFSGLISKFLFAVAFCITVLAAEPRKKVSAGLPIEAQ